MGALTEERRVLVRYVWPDKAMFGAIMLFVTGLVGVYYALLPLVMEVGVDGRVPRWLREYPPLLTGGLSLLAAAAAYASLHTRRVRWTVLGSLAGVGSLGAIGVGAVLSLVALAFAWRAVREREELPEARGLPARMWPDKSLAASMLMLVTGVLTVAWGAGLVLDLIAFQAAELRAAELLGVFGILVGLLCLLAARRLYAQRGLGLGAVAGFGGILAFGYGLLGPVLSAATLVLLYYGWHERDFEAAEPALEA